MKNSGERYLNWGEISLGSKALGGGVSRPARRIGDGGSFSFKRNPISEHWKKIQEKPRQNLP